MFIYRVVATHPVTGKQFASEWYDNDLEAIALMDQMKVLPEYTGFDFIIERKAAV